MVPVDTLLASLHFQVPCNSDYFLKKSILIKEKVRQLPVIKKDLSFPVPTLFFLAMSLSFTLTLYAVLDKKNNKRIAGGYFGSQLICQKKT